MAPPTVNYRSPCYWELHFLNLCSLGSDREAKVGDGRKLAMEKLATDKTIPTPLTPPHLPANIEPCNATH